ncbi:4-hydroxyphenylacetate 3-hydroxylase N-terminal domain-containing protein [Sulfobacillus thermosulfidooxidans]|uniref:4-hydroxyphenylacetate 3-hydroxylase N-terminal domain-containing protein n=1 Tax=Sulfobacillus thermosulfidooxidans TaxID=28034 RepID=UPI0004098B67|nr:4-hydroxyphenylacetate 3-hydroxylase N-terminal domain-containing protein [Sulfobacillus thermosulfidooxidans]
MLQREEEYYASLRDGRRVFYRGELVEDVTAHPVLGKAIRHAAVDFRMAHDPAYRSLAVVSEGHDSFSRYYSIPQTAMDLKRRRDLIAEGTRLGGTVVPLIHEIGTDALFGLLEVLPDVDVRYGTHYTERVRNFWTKARNHDWALAVAQTDVKGDRSRRPADQKSPDAYVRIVNRSSEGIWIRGTKVHTSVAINANWLLVLPTREMRAADQDYAVCCAVPVNAQGLTLVASPYLEHATDVWEHPLSAQHKMVETVTIFDDVFVPWDQVFLAGEWDAAGAIAKAFVEFHRFTAVSYKLPLLQALVGVASLLAEYNGIRHARHVQMALGDLVLYEMTVRSILDNAADQGQRMVSGIFRPNIPLVNLAKYHFATGLHQAFHRVQDIAGGLLVTAPSWEDWQNPQFGEWFEQAFAGHEIGGFERMAVMHLASDLVASELAAYHLVLAVHAEGSIEAERMTIVKDYPWAEAENEIRRLVRENDKYQRGLRKLTE